MQNQTKKTGKYKKRDPLYYYYNINGDIYKYTCDNKNSKYDLRFYCTDSKYPAKAILNIETNEFVILNEKIDKHIEYDKHSYVIPEKLKLKYDNKEFTEKDFLINDNKDLNKYNIGMFIKFMCLEDSELRPTYAKIKFNKLFPNIKINTKEIDYYIYGKYREAKNINKEKIENTKKIFHFFDDNQIEISKTIEYEIKNEEDEIEKNKFILIANEEMVNTLKNNLIEEFFIDATYSCVPSSKPKFKLIVISGYDIESKTTVLSAFILVTDEKTDTFIKIFQFLKNNYQFNPKNIMADCRISQIHAI